MTSISFYGKEYDIQIQLYELIEKTLLKFYDKNINPEKRIINLIKKLKMCITMHPDRCVIIFRTLGIWGLPPDMLFLQFMEKFITKMKIDTIIDYGAGTGLWARIFDDYLKIKTHNIKVIAYDVKKPFDNNEINKQRGYYDIETDIDLTIKNSLLMLIWPSFNTRMANIAIKNFGGDYVLHYGDKSCTGDLAFYSVLNDDWEIIKVFEPLGKLIDEEGEFVDKIYLYKRKPLLEQILEKSLKIENNNVSV